MKIKRFILTVCVALVPMTVALAAGADEKAVRDADEAWSKAANAKDLEKTVSFYAKEAIVMPPNGERATTPGAIRTLWKDLLTDATVSWDTTNVEVAASGDIGYSSGSYKVAMTDPAGKAINDRGKYLVVWKKQADGNWKCVMDIWNSDLPPASVTSRAPGAAEKK